MLYTNKWKNAGIFTANAVIFSLAIYSSPVLSQTSDNTDGFFHNTVSGGLSAGKLIGGDLPRESNIGFDYLYRLNPKWEMGAQLDLIFDKGYENFEAYSVVPIVAYSITDRVPIFFGAGVEHDRATNENEFVLRVGTEYSIFLTKGQQLMLLPGAFVDRIDGEYFLSVNISLGYMF